MEINVGIYLSKKPFLITVVVHGEFIQIIVLLSENSE